MKFSNQNCIVKVGSSRLHISALLMIVVFALLSFTSNGSELPSIAKRSTDQDVLIPPFKMDCVQSTGKNLTLADRFSTDDHDEHAHHRAMLQNKDYRLTTALYSIPDIELISHQGERRRLPDLLDTQKPIMLNFIFTTCTTICPVLSASFHQVQEILGDEKDSVSMISITIDPDYDTPEKLRQYANRFKAGDQWQFYTGTYNDVVTVEKAFDIFRGSKMNHDPITLIRSAHGNNWIRIHGLASADDIVKEYQKIVTAEN